ncbi:MAG: hypothetical protein ACR2LK_04085 [Solirubrobacteraceae bacterium]
MSAAAIDAPQEASAVEPRSHADARVVPWVVVLLAPLIGIAALRAPLVNALIYRDTYFYSGYGWTLQHHIEIFGWPYYSVRFSAILAIGWTTDLFGPVGGYLVLRYVILAGTGALLYLCLRRFASTWIAAASVLLAVLSPFYLRMVLWDYTVFVAVPATIAAAAVWHLGSTPRRQLLTGLATGVLIGIAMFANPLAWPLVPALYGVEAIAALRGGWRAVRLFVGRGVLSVVGIGLVFLGGWLAYRAALGSLPAYQMIKPAVDFAKMNSVVTAPFQIPAHVWLQTEPRVYAPLLMCAAIVLVCGRSLLHATPVARIAQFAIAYTAVFWVFRWVATSSIVETWWSYNLTATTLCFGMPVILHQLATRGGGTRTIAGAMVGATAVADLLIRSLNNHLVSAYDTLRTHTVVLVGVLLAAVVAAVAMRAARTPAGRARAAGAFAVALTAVSLTPAQYLGVRSTGEFSPYGGLVELQAYDAAYRMNALIAQDDQPTERTLIWSGLGGLAGIGWTNLPHQLGAIQDPDAATPLPGLTQNELDVLHYPTTRRILLMAEEANQEPALAALRGAGFPQATIQEHGAWVGGRLHYALVDLRSGAR